MSTLVTGEAVVVELDPARVPTRAMAFAVDAAIQIGLLVTAVVLAARASVRLDSAASAAGSLTVTVLVLVGYPVAWETVTRGRTPGKALLGLRVVRDDGGPVRFRHALVRGLLAVFVDLWLSAGVVGLLVSLLSTRGRRVGDILAGTFVVRDRVRQRRSAELVVPPPLAGWAAALDLRGLPEDLANAVRDFLDRRAELDASVRTRRATELADAVVARVTPAPPVPMTAEGYLVSVLAERRRRAYQQLAGPTRPATAGGWGVPDGQHAPSGSASPAPPRYVAPAEPTVPTTQPRPSAAVQRPARPDPSRPDPSQPGPGFAPPR